MGATKPGEPNLFPDSPFFNEAKDNTIPSGAPSGKGQWNYSIYLYVAGDDPHTDYIDMKDPTIEIKDDP